MKKTDLRVEKSEKDVGLNTLLAADAPLPISVAALIFGVSKNMIKDACKEFKSSRGKIGLRCFTPPGSKKVRVRPSAIHAWFAQLEENEVM